MDQSENKKHLMTARESDYRSKYPGRRLKALMQTHLVEKWTESGIVTSLTQSQTKISRDVIRNRLRFEGKRPPRLDGNVARFAWNDVKISNWS